MENNPEQLILSFIGSLTLSDHLGDVCNDVDHVLRLLGRKNIIKEWEESDSGDLSALGTVLGKHGIKTLYGTPLTDGEQ